MTLGLLHRMRYFLSPPLLLVPSFPTVPADFFHICICAASHASHRELKFRQLAQCLTRSLLCVFHLHTPEHFSICVCSQCCYPSKAAMAGGGRCRRRRSWISSIRRRGVGCKLSIDGGGMDDILVKPDSRDCGEWICARGHRIRRTSRTRVDANGGVYVLDSEDEEAGMEIDASGADLADLGGASVASDAIPVGGDGVMGGGIDVATEGIPADAAVNVAAEEGDSDGVKVEEDVGTCEEMHPKVAARLKMLLDHIDPTFRDVFVNMLKVLVPAFFDP